MENTERNRVARVIARQENEDGSRTVVVQEGDQVVIYTGNPPYIRRTDVVTKDKLRETLAKIKKGGKAGEKT